MRRIADMHAAAQIGAQIGTTQSTLTGRKGGALRTVSGARAGGIDRAPMRRAARKCRMRIGSLIWARCVTHSARAVCR
jgi:hypothetical protein